MILLINILKNIIKSNEDSTGSYRVGGDIKETGSPAAAVLGVTAEEVLLSMTSNLCRRTSLHEVSRNPSPISFTDVL